MNELKANVKFYNSVKGFGFLREKETGEEIFVHATGLVDVIYENDEVTFERSEGKKGPIATNVRVIG